MMKHEGIVIKTIDYSNSSKILYVFTENGVLSVLAKGAKQPKSKFRALAQPLTEISFEMSNGKLPILIDADIVDFHQSIKNDVECTTYATHLMEILYKMEVDNTNNVYNFLKHILRLLPKDPELYAMMFEIKYLYSLGLSPVFKYCVECGDTEIIGFDVYKGGMVCKKHTSDFTNFDSEAILALYKLYNAEAKEVDLTIPRRHLRLIIDQYYEHHLNFTSKSRQIIKDLYHY